MISGRVLLLIGLTVMQWSSAVAGRCLYGSAPGCYFPCNCAVLGECQQETCTTGCSSNTGDYNEAWSGPTCQTGNVAFLKNCSQRGMARFHASLAVDGKPQPAGTPQNADHSYCAHQKATAPYTKRNDPAWWVVDLGGTHKVYSVTIYGRTHCDSSSPTRCYERLAYFTIRVGTDDSYRTGTVCGTYDDPAVPLASPLGGHVTVTCRSPRIGSHVSFHRRIGYQVGLCSLCEVIVIGHKYLDCANIACDAGSCSEVTGCDSCEGTYRPDCTQACDPGSYGINCAQACGSCVTGTTCDPGDGRCPGGCRLWWVGDTCHTQIVRPTVGSETASVSSTTNSSVVLVWDPLSSVDKDLAQFYKYRVSYGEPGKSQQTGSLVSHVFSGLSYEVTGLEHNTVYNLTVITYRVMGDTERSGDSYPSITPMTKCNEPAVAGVLVAEAVNGTEQELGTIVVSYSGIDSGCDELVTISIEYKHILDTRFTALVANLSDTTFTIQPTTSGEHEVRIVATNNEDLSATSQPETVTVIETRATTTVTTPTTVVSSPTTRGVTTEKQTGTKPAGPVVIAVSVVVVLLVVAAIGIGLGVLFWRRRRRKDTETPMAQRPATRRVTMYKEEKGYDNPAADIATGYDKPTVDIATGYDKPAVDIREVSEKPIAKVDPVVEEEAPENIYANTGASSVVAVADFEAYVNGRKQNLKDFESEYKGLPKEDLSKCEVAQTGDNLPRNRYKNIYAYDQNRVILACENDSEPDYINANYITGFNRKNEYIATQGARNTTVLEFWRMIWQEKVNIIVMVANLVENGKGRCAEYWPQIPGGSADIENFTITLEATESSADYTTSVLSVHKGDTTRTVRHFHFKTWEDKGNPLYGIMSLLAFYNKVHAFDNINKAPIVVNCSAGVGRTGTFIVLDILMQQAKVNKEVDVFSCVHRARTERMHMVQTLSQYYFLHDALLEFIKCGDTFIRFEDFEKRYAELCPAAGPSLTLKQQFKLLREMITAQQTGSEKVGATPEHVDKNRNKNTIPENFARPFLPGLEEESYINAVFVNSFKYHDFYLATQLPLPHTVTDFWRLVHSQQSTTVVMLNQPHAPDEIYWPPQDAPSQTYGRIHVSLTDSSFVHRNISVRTFHVTKSTKKSAVESPLVVKHFQLLSWPDDSELPPHPGHLLELRELVLTWHQQKEMTKFKANTIVQCLDGVSHSGLYCGVAYVLDKMKLEQVDPFVAVRFVSQKRPEFFKSLQQYQFLYTMAKKHMAQYSEYANVQ